MRVEMIKEKDAPKPPKQASKAAREVLKILDQIKPGDVAKVTAEEGQTVRGLKVSFGRVASNHGRKIQTWSVPDEPDVLYIKPA